MLSSIDLNRKLGKKEYKKAMDGLSLRLARLQREAKAASLPIIIVIEGWDASGKGMLIGRFIQPLDPRGFKVFTVPKGGEDERMHPFMWKYWTRTPEKGRLHIFDTAWYGEAISRLLDGNADEGSVDSLFQQILSFEEQLAADGTLIIKFFLHISAEEQKKRFEGLESMPETKWRVDASDWEHHKNYNKILSLYDHMIETTDVPYAPWHIIETSDWRYGAVKAMSRVSEILEGVLSKMAADQTVHTGQDPALQSLSEESAAEDTLDLTTSILAGVDLKKDIRKSEYKKKLKELQDEIQLLHSELYRRRIPVVIALEGWDASGKGGAIKRLTEKMDPRGYEVIPTSSPNDIEKQHHYLWRFWQRMPKDGHVAIFDRTWYGRVMVERIEHFCTDDEWKRAYNEINQMEHDLYDHGAVIVKFWLHIDRDEQERRFKERMDNPDKQWKITEEDWRNRDKWDAYVTAVDEMILRTSTTYAPWTIVEANSKPYARIKVLETVIKAIREKMS